MIIWNFRSFDLYADLLFFLGWLPIRDRQNTTGSGLILVENLREISSVQTWNQQFDNLNFSNVAVAGRGCLHQKYYIWYKKYINTASSTARWVIYYYSLHASNAPKCGLGASNLHLCLTCWSNTFISARCFCFGYPQSQLEKSLLVLVLVVVGCGVSWIARFCFL